MSLEHVEASGIVRRPKVPGVSVSNVALILRGPEGKHASPAGEAIRKHPRKMFFTQGGPGH